MASIPQEAAASKLKSGRAERTRYTDQYKAEVVAAFEASSLTAC